LLPSGAEVDASVAAPPSPIVLASLWESEFVADESLLHAPNARAADAIASAQPVDRQTHRECMSQLYAAGSADARCARSQIGFETRYFLSRQIV
jgi:hypothetical protein